MTVLIERDGRVVTVRLNRPAVLNALSSELMTDVVAAMTPLDRDPEVGCFVVTGSARAFAAGADIREMAGRSSVDMLAEDYFAGWDAFAAVVFGLVVYNMAIIAEILRAGLASLPRGQAEAAYAIGLSRTQTLLLVLLQKQVLTLAEVRAAERRLDLAGALARARELSRVAADVDRLDSEMDARDV